MRKPTPNKTLENETVLFAFKDQAQVLTMVDWFRTSQLNMANHPGVWHIKKIFYLGSAISIFGYS
jgi:hypothetical protein